jgi:acyl carrier protein phosphodiesterase
VVSPETRRVAPITLDVMWDHFLSRHWAQLSPELPLPEFVRYAHAQVTIFCPIAAALCQSQRIPVVRALA